MADQLEQLAKRHIGDHYLSLRWKRAADRVTCGWAQRWPVIDSLGKITGQVVSSDDDGYANVDDWAMILISDLPIVEQQRIRETGDNYTNTVVHWEG